MKDKIKILLSSEETSNFYIGGVNVWIEKLITKLTEFNFTIYNIIINPYLDQNIKLPRDVAFIKVPFIGNDELFEKVYKDSLHEIKSIPVNRGIIHEKFLGLFKELIEEFISVNKNPTKLGEISFALHNYFKEYSVSDTIKSELVWEAYRNYVMIYTSDRKNNIEQPDTYSIVQSIGWIFKYLNILSGRIPRSDVTHSVYASFCSIPCVLAKIANNTPFILTAHAFNLLEQYPQMYLLRETSFLKNFLIRLYSSITGLSNFYSDYISDMNAYNTVEVDERNRDKFSSGALPNSQGYYVFKEVIDNYREAYLKYTDNISIETKEQNYLVKQKLELEKGFTLFMYGYYEEAIIKFRCSLKMGMSNIAMIAVLYNIAEVYIQLGDLNRAIFEMEKINLLKI